MTMKRIKNFVQDQIVARGEKSDVLSSDLINADKKFDILRHTCTITEKKITACLKGAGMGTDSEKRLKKFPEYYLAMCLQECSEQLSSDSILGQILLICSVLEKKIGQELVNYELDVEKNCLSPLNNLIESDIPNVLKSRKALTRATQEMEACRARYQTAFKQTQQNIASNGTMAANKAEGKAEATKQDLDNATVKVEQSKNAFATDVLSLICREPEIAQIYLDLFKLQLNYHQKLFEVLNDSIPKLEKLIQLNSKKTLFGVSLEDHLCVTGRVISYAIETCVGLLLHNINEEGLFRISGSASKVRKLRFSLNLNMIDLDEYVHDPHTVAGCLKMYLRDLPEPLLTFQLYPAWIDAAKQIDLNCRLQSLWGVCTSLPDSHFNNLKYMIKFLNKIANQSKENRMTSNNIAIALAPSLIRSPSAIENEQFESNMDAANLHTLIIEALVSYADWFFPGDVDFVMPVLSTKHINGDNLQPRVVKSAPRSVKKPAPPAPNGLENKVSFTAKAQPENLLVSGIDENKLSETKVTCSLDRKVYRYSDKKDPKIRNSILNSGRRPLNRPSVIERPTDPPPEKPLRSKPLDSPTEKLHESVDTLLVNIGENTEECKNNTSESIVGRQKEEFSFDNDINEESKIDLLQDKKCSFSSDPEKNRNNSFKEERIYNEDENVDCGEKLTERRPTNENTYL